MTVVDAKIVLARHSVDRRGMKSGTTLEEAFSVQGCDEGLQGNENPNAKATKESIPLEWEWEES